ncbi:hypothetical protein K438DRAFT_1973832 [Mycena galopus ATCC 62051]|nr:hypothetical protein K438DRAFT_1973832 [Mycena galopus ATCC 62051]
MTVYVMTIQLAPFVALTSSVTQKHQSRPPAADVRPLQGAWLIGHQTGANAVADVDAAVQISKASPLVDAAQAFSRYDVDAHRHHIGYSSPLFHHIPLPFASINSNPCRLTLAQQQNLRARPASAVCVECNAGVYHPLLFFSIGRLSTSFPFVEGGGCTRTPS